MTFKELDATVPESEVAEETRLTPEQEATGREFFKRMEASAIRDQDGEIQIIPDRELVHEFREWCYKEKLRWTDEFEKIMENSFAYFDFKERERNINEMWEINGPDPVDHAALYKRPENGIFTLTHTAGICQDWWGRDNGYRAIPPSSEHAVIDRSIAYWNERGHNLSRPGGVRIGW